MGSTILADANTAGMIMMTMAITATASSGRT